MNLHTLREQPHLSASGINDYLECSLSYKFSRVDRIEFEHTSDALLMGQVIHKAIEAYYQAKKNNLVLTLEDLQNRFEEHWLNALEDEPKVHYKEGKDAETCLKEGRELIATFYRELPVEDFKVVATEMAFSLNIEGLEIPLIGVMDLLLMDPESNQIIIVDHKTSSRAYSKDDIEKSLQLTLYYMAAKQYGYEGEDILLRFDCLIKNKKPRLEQYYTVRTDEDEKRLVKKIQQVWNAIGQNIFIPNDSSWKCGYCSFKNHCDQWFKQ